MEFEVDKQIGRIHYGFGKEYLPKWGIKEALREIYQNFIDYGDYEESYIQVDDVISVELTNAWQPANLEYLRIGNTKKENDNAIGHHGEGLKMAFLILLREGFESSIFTNKYSVTPIWYTDMEIGDCFAFEYEIHDFWEAQYTVKFQCKTDDYLDFKLNLIKPEDVVYSHYEYGDIVSKEAGNIYSGGLWVAKVDGMSKAYNIKPKHLPLDRDRSVPRAFDVNWTATMILQASEKMSLRDLSYSDTAYISSVPKHLFGSFKPRKVGNNIEFTYKDEHGKDKVVASHIKNILITENFFLVAINKLKRFLAKQLGLYDMLLDFKKKHVHSTEALQDFEIILSRVKK